MLARGPHRAAPLTINYIKREGSFSSGLFFDETPVAIAAFHHVPPIKAVPNLRMTQRAAAAITHNLIDIRGNMDGFGRGMLGRFGLHVFNDLLASFAIK